MILPLVLRKRVAALLDKLKRWCLDLFHLVFSKGIPVVYFDGRKNVGDMLNAYIVEKVTGKNIYKAHTNKFKHARVVGSVIGSASSMSYIYGGGSIDGVQPKGKLDKKKIFALRGKKTLDLVKNNCGDEDLDVSLGDPALLMPLFYKPPEQKKIYSVGIVPHFSDEQSQVLKAIEKDESVTVISVSEPVERFIDKIVQCEFILSSSLHGLILADSYNIPNKRVVLGGAILGGNYKFEDYYSTTDCPDEQGVEIVEANQLRCLIERAAGVCLVKNFLGCRESLLDAVTKVKRFT